MDLHSAMTVGQAISTAISTVETARDLAKDTSNSEPRQPSTPIRTVWVQLSTVKWPHGRMQPH